MEKLMTFEETLACLNVSKSWLRSQIFKRKISFIKVGKLIRFRRSDIEEFIKENLKKDSQGEIQ